MIASSRDQFLQYQNQLQQFINATSQVSDSSWKKMCEIMRFYEVKKGTRLLDYMRIEQAVRFLGKGIVKCEDHFYGKSFVYDFRVAPIILSETVSFFNNTPSRLTLEAVTDCEFIELPREPFIKLLFSNFDLAKFATTGVANYLGMTHYKIALLRTLSAEKRYKLFLREFPMVAKYCELNDISSYLNVTPQSLSRIRKTIQWAEDEKELKALSNELEVVHGKSGTSIT
jgi:hypothetical protein